jgi:ribosomal-protein-alanine N-acetyltransferase
MERTGPDPKSTNSHTLTTERLRIVPPAPEDAGRIYKLIGGDDREAICATLVWDGPDSAAEVENWIELSRTETFSPFGFHWAIRDSTTGNAIGAIGTRPRGEPGRADVGYWLGKAYWGQGLMGEALGALLGYGFNELGYYKMEADVFSNNTRGRRLVESAGMTQEGTIRSAYLKSGETVDTVLYGILFEEWKS